MSKRKLIGAIIGVLAFVALIASATFAALVFSFNATNSNYNTKIMNFNINYTNGTDITSLPVLSEGTPSNASSLTVKAKLAPLSAPGDLTIYLNTTSSTSSALFASGAINYAVCEGTCLSFDNITTKGVLTSSTPAKLAILTGSQLTTSEKTYNVYFWVNSARVYSELIGESYSGYISAEAIQVDTR